MSDADRRFWAFKPQLSLVAFAILLTGFIGLIAILRTLLNWPSEQSEKVVLLGALVLSLLPIALALVDVIIERGAVVEYRGVKFDFSRSKDIAAAGLVIPPNIGVPGQPVTDSSTAQILDTLKQATTSDLVVIDLEDGQAWWETRLLVLLAGAVRLKKPDKVVFVGKDGNVGHRFQGWSYPNDLLRSFLTANAQYKRSLQAAAAAAGQWRLVEPLDSIGPNAPVPPAPPWLSGRLATSHGWMAFDALTGLHNELFEEQLLQSELGQKFEMQASPLNITLVRLEDLFRPVLHKDSIDMSWPTDRQLEVFMSFEAPFVALTTDGRYSALVSRQTLITEMLKSLVSGTNRKE